MRGVAKEVPRCRSALFSPPRPVSSDQVLAGSLFRALEGFIANFTSTVDDDNGEIE